VKIKIGPLPLLITIYSLLLISAVMIQSDIWRIIIGLPYMLFFPGYVLQAAIFPKKSDLDGVERIGFCLGLSIVVISLIGLVLNYSPWGIKVYPVLIVTVIFVLLTATVAWLRQLKLLSEHDKPTLLFLNFTNWKSTKRRNKIMIFLLTSGIVVLIGIFVFSVIAAPKAVEKYTEFYILGPDGKVGDYPSEVVVGDVGNLICNITNHENQQTSYEIIIEVDGVINQEIGPIILTNDQTWMNTIGFTPTRVADNQKVDILLFKNGQNNSNINLFFTINVLPLRPIIVPIGDQTVVEGSPLVFTVSASDPNNRPLTYTATNLPTGASLQGQTFFWTPAAGQAGIYSNITFTVSNGASTASEQITITVNK